MTCPGPARSRRRPGRDELPGAQPGAGRVEYKDDGYHARRAGHDPAGPTAASANLKTGPPVRATSLPETLKDTPPYGLLPKLLRNGSFLAAPLDWWEPEYAALDIPLQAYLKQLGADDEAIRLIDANLNGESIETLSALDLLRKLAVLQGAGAPQDVSGGTQRLPDAMHDSINPFVLTGKQVTSINTASSGIRLLTADSDSYTCRLCLVALPFSVLRRLDVQAPLSGPKQQAILHMGYTPVTHVFMKPRSPFWLADGLSPNMWTDTDLGRVFTQTGEQGEVIRLRAWIQGSTAGRLEGTPDDELGKHVVSTLEQARPAARSQLEVERVMSWGKNPFAYGAFSHYPAGGGPAGSAGGKPAGGTVAFHRRPYRTFRSGMEAAVKSGTRGAHEVIKRLA